MSPDFALFVVVVGITATGLTAELLFPDGRLAPLSKALRTVAKIGYHTARPFTRPVLRRFPQLRTRIARVVLPWPVLIAAIAVAVPDRLTIDAASGSAVIALTSILILRRLRDAMDRGTVAVLNGQMPSARDHQVIRFGLTQFGAVLVALLFYVFPAGFSDAMALPRGWPGVAVLMAMYLLIVLQLVVGLSVALDSDFGHGSKSRKTMRDRVHAAKEKAKALAGRLPELVPSPQPSPQPTPMRVPAQARRHV